MASNMAGPSALYFGSYGDDLGRIQAVPLLLNPFLGDIQREVAICYSFNDECKFGAAS